MDATGSYAPALATGGPNRGYGTLGTLYRYISGDIFGPSCRMAS